MTRRPTVPSSPAPRAGRLAVLLVMPAVVAAALVSPAARPTSAATAAPAWTTAWQNDPAWHQGKAEWAVYDAVRPIYGTPRRYEATIFTNTQHMDPATTTKAEDWREPAAVTVFKHNVSEMIPTENYTYRFLTTFFARTGSLAPWKLVMSSQEDCGATYKQFQVDGETVRTESFSYFPGEGPAPGRFERPDDLQFHDGLSLVLRSYPFDDRPTITLDLVPDQTDTHATRPTPARATVRHDGVETLSVPFGRVEAHRVVVEHPADGGVARSVYWFAADRALRHVMVKYEGPYGVRYELAHLDWWAYWQDPRPER